MDKINIDLLQLEQLVEDEKFEQARALLVSYFSQPLSPEERGQAYVDVASVYLDITNYFNKQRVELMESAAKSLADLNKQSAELDDLINLDKVRKSIKGS